MVFYLIFYWRYWDRKKRPRWSRNAGLLRKKKKISFAASSHAYGRKCDIPSLAESKIFLSKRNKIIQDEDMFDA
jgi:hypothetical protein